MSAEYIHVSNNYAARRVNVWVVESMGILSVTSLQLEK
jgi:hypothetical protein